MRSTPYIGPSVNGFWGDATTPTCAHSRPCRFASAAGDGPGSLRPYARLSGAPSRQPARTTGISWAMSPDSGFQTRCGGRPS